MTDAIKQEPSPINSSGTSSSSPASLLNEFKEEDSPSTGKLPNGTMTVVVGPETSSSSSSNSNSSCPSPAPSNHNNRNQMTSSEMCSAVEELRRENERILAELANTQEVLDLFENYRSLIKEHMNMCICSGRDYHLGKWRKYEAEYRKLLPIKRVIEPNLSQKASELLEGIVSVGPYGELYNNQRVTNGGFEMPKYKIGPGFNLETNQVMAKSWVPTGDITCSTIGNPTKSKIRSFLDTIIPIGDPNLIPTLPLLPENLKYNYNQSPSGTQTMSHSSSSQSLSTAQQVPCQTQSNQVLMHKGNQIIVRKRGIVPPELMNNMSDDEASSGQVGGVAQGNSVPGFVIKKAKLGNSLAPGQKFTILTTNNKFTIGGGKVGVAPKIIAKLGQGSLNNDQAPDQEEERLDQLNNALDQILMGRYDALNQLQPRISQSRTNAQGVMVTQPMNIIQGDDADDSDDEDDNELDPQQRQNAVYDGDDDDEDIIFLDEVKTSNSTPANAPTATAIAVPLKPKIKLLSNANTAPSILGAALESGFKPYPTYHQISTTSSTRTISTPITAVVSTNSAQPVMNHATIKIYQPPVNVNQNTSHTMSHNSTGLANNITVINNKALFQKRPHLTNEERMDIINRLKKNESGARIARDYGITKQAVSAIKRRAQLMGDNFANSHTYISAFNVANSSSTNGGHSIKASPVSINLSASNSPSPVDNSLVSRQLKQQKVNASVMRQSNMLANMSRSTSTLCLPVNPVAILKSQMAKQKQHSNHGSGSSTPTGTTSPIPRTKLKIDAKRLLLPRLLQGTETYQTYAFKNPADGSTQGSSQRVTHNYEQNQSELQYDDDDGQQILDESQNMDNSSGSSSPNNDRHEEEDEEVIFVKRQVPVLGQVGVDEEQDENSQDYEDADNGFDPGMMMDFDAYEPQTVEDEEEPQHGYDEEDDINNNPDMDMFPTIESQVNDAIGPIGDEDDIDDNEDDDGEHKDDLNHFDESLLMSD